MMLGLLLLCWQCVIAFLIFSFAYSISSFRFQISVFPAGRASTFTLHLTPYIIINSKWTMDWNIKAKTTELLEVNRSKALCNLVVVKDFLDCFVLPISSDSLIHVQPLSWYSSYYILRVINCHSSPLDCELHKIEKHVFFCVCVCVFHWHTLYLA